MAPPRSSAAVLEQWLGLRGAAALGAIVLVIAAAYFFKYSIEHQLVSPLVRLVTGAVVGCACLLASESRLQRDNRTLAQFLGGAGSAILYFAAWASSAVYALVPDAVAFVLMAAVTALTCLLAVRRSSVPTAALGLLAGFASPVLLARGGDHPVTLFGYLGLLNLGMLALARRQRWAWLVLASALATALYQLAWILGRMDASRVGLGGLVIVGFGALFAAFARFPEQAGDTSADGSVERVPEPWMLRAARLVGLGGGLLFGYHLATSVELGSSFAPIGGMLVIITVGALVLAARDVAPWLALAAAGGAVPILLAFELAHPPAPGAHAAAGSSRALGALVATMLGLGLLHAIAGRVHRRSGRPLAERPVGVTVLGFGSLLVLLVAATGGGALAALPFLAGLFGVFVLLVDEARVGESPRLLVFAPPAVLVVLASGNARHAPGLVSAPIMLALFVFALGLTAGLTLWFRDAARRASALGLFGAGAVLAFHMLSDLRPAWSPPLHASAIALAMASGTFAAVRLERGAFVLGAALVSLLPWWVLSAQIDETSHVSPGERAAVLGLSLVSGLGTLVLPRVSRVLRHDVGAYRAGALVLYGPLVLGFVSWQAAFHTHHGGGLVALIAAMPLVGLALVVLVDGELAPDAQTSMLAWLTASASMLVALAIGVELRKEWLTIAWALEGAALLALFRRIDHFGLKSLATLLFGAVFLRLAANPELLRYHAAHGAPVWNWLLYAYGVPIAAMLAGVRLHRGIEVARHRPFERSLVGERPWLSALLALGALVLGFVFVNLTVLDAFSKERAIALTFERLPARDLTLSGVWAAYALVVVALGIRLRSVPLRLVSMLMLLLTVGKVFLYDLGALEELYRVASLVGLALTLIVVSLAYQRFVFRIGSGDEVPPNPGA